VTILAAVALASFLFKDDDFFGARLSDNFAGDFGVGDQRRTNFDLAIAADGTLTIAYLYKGGVYNRLERYNEALECYEQALRAQGGAA